MTLSTDAAKGTTWSVRTEADFGGVVRPGRGRIQVVPALGDWLAAFFSSPEPMTLGPEEPVGRTLTERMPAGWLVERLSLLAPRCGLNSELSQQVQELARAAKTFLEVRNANVHGFWVALEGGGVVRLRSVLRDGNEGPEFQLGIAEASDGQLSRAAEIMEEFAKQAHLLERVRAESR